MNTSYRLAPTAVLVDGSALYFASRALFPDASIDYGAFVDLLVERFGASKDWTGDAPLSLPTAGSRWIFWTAFSSRNDGQARFLEMLENRFGFEVRRFAPSDSRIVEGLGDTATDRLTRFDASIGYMIGRMAEEYRVVVVSDAFALAEPLVRASRARADAVARTRALAPARARATAQGLPSFAPNAVAFFGRGLDPRWLGVERGMTGASPTTPRPVVVYDLDDEAHRLVGTQGRVERESWFTPDSPPRP